MNALAKYRLSFATLLAVGLAVAFGPSAAQAQSSDQVALVALSSYDEITEDVSFVGKLIGKPEMVQQMEGMLTFMTQGKGLAGLDKSKPIGVAVYAQGEELSIVGMLPISDKDALIDLLKGFQIPIEEGDDGVIEITGPNQTLYAKNVGDWILVAQQAEQLAAAPADPGKAIATLSESYDIGARIYGQNIPQSFLDMATGAIKGGLEKGLEREDNESDEQYELRKKFTIKQIEQIEQVLEEMDELTVGWTIDGKEERTYLDFTFTAVAGTKLAKQMMAAYADAKTNYAGFYQPDAAGMIVFSSVMSQEDIDQAMEMLPGLKEQILNGIENESDLPDEKSKVIVKAAIDDFYDAVVETLKGGKSDGGAVLHLSPDALTFVAGGLCTDPDKVKAGLKKLEALAEKEPEFPGIEWDAASHAGVSFHTVRVPIPDKGEETDNAKILFGAELEVVLGTGDNSVYFALGRDALAKCKAVIDESKANLGKSIATLEMSVSLGQIIDVIVALEDDEISKMIADILKTEAQGSDHIRITASVVERGIMYRVELEKGVLKAIGKAVEMNQ